MTHRNLALIRMGITAGARLVRPVPGVDVRDEAEQGARVRVYRLRTGTEPAALLWIHGGGLIVGRPEADEVRASRVAAALGITVVSVRYRLAPEQPYPAALDDCRAAWRWLQRHADGLGVDPSRVVVGGASAGAGLAAALAQRLHDEGGPQPAGQLLLYPMLDDRTGADSTGDGVRHPVWDTVSNRTGWSAYLGRLRGGDPPPYSVPASRRDLSGLPPAWIGVGTADLFLDEDRDYAERLQTSGVPVEYVEVQDVPHGFDTLTTPRKSQDFWSSQLSFLSARLQLPAVPPPAVLASLPTPAWIDRAPVRVEATVDIAAPPDQVWPQIDDHAGWADWFSGVSVVVTGRASGVGGRRRVRVGPLRFDEVFTVWEPGEHVAFAVTSSTLPLLARMAESVRLEATDRGTRLTYRQGLQGRPGFDRALAAFWSPAARRLPAVLATLRRRVESSVSP